MVDIEDRCLFLCESLLTACCVIPFSLSRAKKGETGCWGVCSCEICSKAKHSFHS
jgi:hypothetical protein